MRTATVGAIAGAFLLVLAIPSLTPAANASPVTPAGITTSGSQWAYGGWTWANSSLTFPNGTLEVTSFFGWHVIYTATNTSNSTTMLEVERTAGAQVTASFCSPGCGNATATANLSIQGWERSFGFVNLTRDATVTLNGSQAVPAWGITNQSGSDRENLTESVDFATTAHGGHALSSYLAVSAATEHAISFASPLGVVPKGVAPGDSWTSSANYTATGAWNASILYAHTGILGTTASGRLAPSGSFAGNGSLTLYGTDFGAETLANGETTQAIGILVAGPYTIHEGLLLIPSDLDVFSTGIHPWDGYGFGSAALRTDRADLRMDGNAAPQVAAAESGYAGAPSAITPVSPPTKVGPAAASAPAQGEIQGEPENPTVAEQQSACLISACGGATPGPTGPGGFIGLGVVVGLLVVVVVGTVGVIEYRQWQKRSRRSRDLVGHVYDGSSGAVPPGTTLTAPTRPADGTGSGLPSAPPEESGPSAPRGPY